MRRTFICCCLIALAASACDKNIREAGPGVLPALATDNR